MGKKTRRKFSDEFKAETVRLVRESGKSIGAAARELGLTETAVRRWVELANPSVTPTRVGMLTLEEREELTVALDDGLMLLHQGQGVLVKDARVWYHGSKLLAGQVGQRFFYSACKRGLCQEWAP